MMLDAVTAIISLIIALFTAFWGIYIFYTPPIFSRKRLSYKLELSTPLIHESAKASSDLAVRYGKKYRKKPLKDPHIVRIRLSNTGRKDVRSDDFDQATPLQLDLGAKIVAVLNFTCSIEDMPDPELSVSEKRLNINPSLIPRHAAIAFVLLVDGPCTAVTHKSPLIGVSLKQELIKEQKYGINAKTVAAWLALAFAIWWIIESPASAARLVHGIGAFLSEAAQGISNFFASL